jgi:predicted transcriptional regulator
MFMRRELKRAGRAIPKHFRALLAPPGVQPRLRRTPSAVKCSRMEVQLTSEQQAKLARIATEQGRAAETLVQEAVEQFLNYDEWFSLEVDKGMAAADRGEFVDHGAIRKMIDSRYPLNARSLDAARRE